MTTTTRWTDGEVARLRRHLAAAREEHPDSECRAVADVAGEFGISSAQVREVIARADRQRDASHARYARDALPGRAAQVDLYSQYRGGLIERLARLAGRTTFREPTPPGTTSDTVPYEHGLTMAVVWLRDHRQDAHDVTADILHGLAIMSMPQRVEDRCVDALAHALADMSHMVARMPDGLRDACTRTLLRRCIDGLGHPYPPSATRLHIGLFDGLGVRIVWAQADQGLRRAGAALV